MSRSRKREIPNATIWAALITGLAIIIGASIGLLHQGKRITQLQQVAPNAIYPMTAAMLMSCNDGHYDQADKLADGILAFDSDNHRALNMKGAIAFYRNSYSTALDYFTKARKAVPDTAPDTASLMYAYTMNLADTYVETGGYKRAIELYQSVSDNSPEWSYGIGRAYMHSGQYDEALKYLENVPSNNGRGRARALEAACYMGLADSEHDANSILELKNKAKAKLQDGIIQDKNYWHDILTGQIVDVHESHTIARKLLRELLLENDYALQNESQGDCCRFGGPP